MKGVDLILKFKEGGSCNLPRFEQIPKNYQWYILGAEPLREIIENPCAMKDSGDGSICCQ